MTVFILSLMAFSQVTQAAEWSELLQELPAVKSHSVLKCLPETQKLCAHPYENICTQGLTGTYDDFSSSLRRQLSPDPKLDLFDEQAAVTLSAQKVLDDLRQEEQTALQSRFRTIDYDAKLRSLREREVKAAESLLIEQKKQIILDGKLEKIIFAQYHLKPSDLKLFVDSIKEDLIAEVKNNPQFNLTSDETVLRLGSSAIVDKLKIIKTDILSEDSDRGATPQTDNELFREVDGYTNLLEACQADGLGENAAYNAVNDHFYVCPGLSLKFLAHSQGNLAALSFIVGHELSHSFDSHQYAIMSFSAQKELTQKYPRARSDQITTEESFKNFTVCIDQNYIQDPAEKFATIDSFLKQIKENGIPNLEKALLAASAANPVDLERVAFLKRKILVQQNNLSIFEFKKAQSIQNPVSVIERVKGELEADFGATYAMVSKISTLAPEKREALVKSSLQLFCATPKVKEIWDLVLDGTSDPDHPPDRFRVENVFRNEKIRSLLGCTPLTQSDRPSCGL